MKKLLYLMAFLLWLSKLLDAQTEQGQLAFTITEPNLIPEGINYNPKTKSFLVSSIHLKKIISLNAQTKEVKDFIGKNAEGYQGGVGLAIDKKRKLLYALCYSKVDGNHITGLYGYDLKTQKLQFHILKNDTIPKIYNDLVFDKKGNLYITDTFRSKIWILKKGNQQLEEFYHAEKLHPNGIAIDKKRKIIYLASWDKGIAALNLDTKKLSSIHPKEVTSKRIDGLYFYKNSLIGIQNYGDAYKSRIARFYLNKQQQVIKTVILDTDHSLFDTPTTGVIIKDKFYCLANSQIPKLDQDTNQIKKGLEVTDTYILVYQL